MSIADIEDHIATILHYACIAVVAAVALGSIVVQYV